MVNLDLCKYLISINEDLINRTAISSCHCFGLNSFIINEKPKIRLFVADKDCELFGDFNIYNPIIPIHPHKYDDIFLQIEGGLVHYIYKIKHNGVLFNKYSYNRLSDNNSKLELVGEDCLDIVEFGTITQLKANELHTVSLTGERCSWMIIETFKDENFKQFSYHKNLTEREGLYIPIENGVEYLKNYYK